jgi:hypothetical protein
MGFIRWKMPIKNIHKLFISNVLIWISMQNYMQIEHNLILNLKTMAKLLLIVNNAWNIILNIQKDTIDMQKHW